VYRRKDSYYTRAKTAGYRSRAAYKLIELDKRFGLLHRGDRVVDLGAWPGGWLQVAAQRVGSNGVVVGIDLKPIDALPPPVVCLRADLRVPETITAIRARCGGEADLVLSDMAPHLSGVRATDEARAHELAERAITVARELLRRGGRLVLKLFQDSDTESVLAQLRGQFERVSCTRPDATRNGSAEVYAVASGFRGVVPPA
jgi:23S rRNA (uridine2552-2'-O)-methyltransferase